MQQIYESYKRHDWSGDKEWQNYLNNIYPIPSREKVEKIRRKWYKKNRDSSFDIDYNPDLES